MAGLLLLAVLLVEHRELHMFGEKQGNAAELADGSDRQRLWTELKEARQLIRELQGGNSAPTQNQLPVLQCFAHRPVHRRIYRSHIDVENKGVPQIFADNATSLPYRLCTGHNRGDQACRAPWKDDEPAGRILTFDELSQQEKEIGISHALTARLQRLDQNNLQKSRKALGNVFRYRNFLCKLLSGKPTRLLVIGGSNAHNDYLPSDEKAWPEILQDWLNEEFPVDGGHVVVNRGFGGSGSCTFAPRVSFLMQEKAPLEYDLVLAELAINDAQFADQVGAAVGYLPAPAIGGHYSIVATCFEIFIRNVLKHSEEVALVLLELPGFRLKFATAGEMHHTLANFYQIPHLSLKDAVWPAMRARTGIFVGYSENAISKYFWPSDPNHVGLWGHHALVDVIAYMIEFEASFARAHVPEYAEPPPHEYSPVEKVGGAAERCLFCTLS
jgi:lysophospholipase L1-like esterase